MCGAISPARLSKGQLYETPHGLPARVVNAGGIKEPPFRRMSCKVVSLIVGIPRHTFVIAEADQTASNSAVTTRVARAISYEESALPAVQEALEAPAMWTIGRSEGETPFAGCLLESGIFLSAATGDTGCPAN